MTTELMPVPKQQYFDSPSGRPLSGGKLYTYAAGTTTPKATYTDAAGTTPQANPIILNSRGEPDSPIFWSGAYKIALYDSSNNLIYTVDNYTGALSKFSDTTGSAMIGAENQWGAAYLKTVSDIHNGQEVEIDRFLPSSKISAIRAGTSDYDCGPDLAAAIPDFVNGGGIYAKYGRYIIESGDIPIVSNFKLRGDGMGATKFRFLHSSNPSSSEFMFSARRVSNVAMRDLTLESNAYETLGQATDLFDLGTYDSVNKTYSGSLDGNINLFLISSCTDVRMSDVELKGPNYHGVRVSVEGALSTDYNERLIFERIYGHHCRVSPIDILGTKRYWIVGGTFTDNGLFTADYIDGGTGYGIVAGRTPSASQLRSKDGWVGYNFCARNARHAIDVHAGADIRVFKNKLEDALLIGIGIQDLSGSADDSLVGDFFVEDNEIWHTSWVESKYPLITYQSAGVERNDSCPILVSAASASLLQSAYIRRNKIKDWRYRQLVANVAGTDTVMPIVASANKTLEVVDNEAVCENSSYYPSAFVDLSSPQRVIFENNLIRAGIRSTVSKAAVRIYSGTFNTEMEDNTLDRINVYSNAVALTQAAYPYIEFVRSDDAPRFRNNDITETTQGTRGSLLKTSTTNAKLGYNGFFSINEGNTFNGAAYASEVSGSRTFYFSAAGSGRYDGSDASNAFSLSSASNLDFVLAQLPVVRNGTLTLELADKPDFGSGVPSSFVGVPCIYSDKVTWSGVDSESTLSDTKTAGMTTTGSNLLNFPQGTNNNIEYLQLKSNGIVVRNAVNVNACALKNTVTTAGTYCYLAEKLLGEVRNTSVEKGAIGIAAEDAAQIVAINNAASAGGAPTTGLSTNGGRIMKNGTNPSVESSSNGGSIA